MLSGPLSSPESRVGPTTIRSAVTDEEVGSRLLLADVGPPGHGLFVGRPRACLRLGRFSTPPHASSETSGLSAGIFEAIATEALRAYDKIVGLDLAEVCVDGSVHKAPAGGEGTRPSPVDRSKLGWKWSIATDAAGIPIGWVGGGANRHDDSLLGPTLDTVATHGLLADLGTLHLDRGYDSQWVRAGCAERGLGDLVIAERKRKTGPEEQNPGTSRSPSDCASRPCRADQLVALELRADAAQYRPLRHASGGPDGSGHRLDLDRPSSSTGGIAGPQTCGLSADALNDLVYSFAADTPAQPADASISRCATQS